jgi:hypothetical protein
MNRPFSREDIPGIDTRLRDLAAPAMAAQQLGVPMSQLAAQQISDASKTPRDLVNDFYIKPKAQ